MPTLVSRDPTKPSWGFNCLPSCYVAAEIGGFSMTWDEHNVEVFSWSLDCWLRGFTNELDIGVWNSEWIFIISDLFLPSFSSMGVQALDENRLTPMIACLS